MTSTPFSRLCDFFDPIADHIHSVEMKQRARCSTVWWVYTAQLPSASLTSEVPAMYLLDTHTWTKSSRPISLPNNGFWEQLIHCEFQLLGKNTMHTVNSLW